MSLHIKTVETTYEGARLFGTLNLIHDAGKVAIAVRLTEIKKTPKSREHLLGMARLNVGGELCNLTVEGKPTPLSEVLNTSQCAALEQAIAEAIS